MSNWNSGMNGRTIYINRLLFIEDEMSRGLYRMAEYFHFSSF